MPVADDHHRIRIFGKLRTGILPIGRGVTYSIFNVYIDFVFAENLYNLVEELPSYRGLAHQEVFTLWNSACRFLGIYNYGTISAPPVGRYYLLMFGITDYDYSFTAIVSSLNQSMDPRNKGACRVNNLKTKPFGLLIKSFRLSMRPHYEGITRLRLGNTLYNPAAL